jgi:cyclase
MKKILLAALLISCKLAAQQNMDNAVISTVKINDHIHMLQWAGAGNMLLLSGADGNILIDDQFAPLTTKISAAIQAINPGNVKFLFNTHYHGDHAGGNENFANLGATIFAHENVRARLAGDKSIITFKQEPKPSPEKALPVLTYTTGMKAHFNGEDIVIFHVDNAHTDGDALFYFPKSNVLHTGDCFMKDRFPFIDRNSGGSVDGWLKAVSQVLTLVDDDTIIMPGHGDLANKKDYKAVRDAVMQLRDSVKKAIKNGQTLEQILAANLTKDFDSNFGSGFIKGNAIITTIFNELSGIN